MNMRSEYNLMIGGNPNETIGFAFVADMKATACILRLLPNCPTNFYHINRDGDYIANINWTHANRSLDCINWKTVRRGLQEFMAMDSQQDWVVAKMLLILNLIEELIKRESPKKDIMTALSKENLVILAFGN